MPESTSATDTKNLHRIVPAEAHQMGATLVKQPLPAPGLRKVGPFILLHHFGPSEARPGEDPLNVGAHPHRGFQPVTILFDGEVRHRDSLGNDGVIKAGEVQWITAGRGIIHSEKVSDEFRARGGVLEGIQLWVNLPAQHKMVPPAYQEVRADDMPTVEIGDLRLEIIAGTFGQAVGPVSPYSRLTVGIGRIPADGASAVSLPDDMPTAIYLVKGRLRLPNDRVLHPEELALFEEPGGNLPLAAEVDSSFLFLQGENIPEPMAQYGPFVMNRPEEIQQALADYQAGKMGELPEEDA